MSAANKFERLDFEAINAALLSDVVGYASQWFGGGTRSGHNFFAPSTKSGGIGDSWSVSTSGAAAGRWMHGASGDSGGDMISLYAAIYNLTQIEAAKQLADMTGCKPIPARDGGYAKPKAAPVAASKGEAALPDEDFGSIICPVPANAPTPHAAHIRRGAPAMRWTYHDGESVLGYVYRFVTSDGGKDTIPHTLWLNPRTGSQEWHWRTWAEPRPIYRPTKHSLVSDRKVIVVEGEKCAFNLDNFLLENGCTDYDVVSWVGGSGQVKRIDWQPLAGRTCILWPDADSQRVKPTPTEIASFKVEGVVDKEALKAFALTKPYLEFERQPGQKCMDTLAQTLLGLGCAVSMIPLPPVATLPDGWDCADAIGEGWGLDKVLAFVAGAKTVSDEASLAQAGDLEEADAADQGSKKKKRVSLGDWRDALRYTPRDGIEKSRENVVLAMQNDPALVGVVKFNEFSSRIDVVLDLPWRKRGTEWSDTDSLHLGMYLCDTFFFPSMNSGTLHEAVSLCASINKYHPIRDHLVTLDNDGVAQIKLKHDGVPRLDDWLIRCVVGSPDALTPEMRQYISLCGRFFIMAMVKRVISPGCKFDYCLVLKGAQGVGKSTLFKALGGKYFSDTKVRMDVPKEGGEQIQGVWVIEVPEMAGFNKAEVNDVKAFIASEEDRFRPAYARSVVNFPRQTVFGGSTNDDTPLRDPTGARRFWVIDVSRQVDNAYLREVRMQLFAEALVALKAGDPCYPDHETENALFKPEQERHTVVPLLLEKLAYLFANDVGDWGAKNEWTVSEIAEKLGETSTKITPTLQANIGAAMRKLWGDASRKQKRVGGVKVWKYVKPLGWPPREYEDVATAASATNKASTGVSPSLANPPIGDDDDMPF